MDYHLNFFFVLRDFDKAGFSGVATFQQDGRRYTFDNDMHLYLKRAHVFRHLFGEPTDVLAELLAEDRAQ